MNTRERDLLEGLRLQPLEPDETNIFVADPLAAELGQKFFFDPRFSGPLGEANMITSSGRLGEVGERDKVACVSCHDPARGGTDHRSRPNASSLAAGWTGRNAPTVLNAAYSPKWQFWDGRKDSLWSQALGPLESPVEHNGTRLQYVRLVYEYYRAEYEQIFGPMPDFSDTSSTGRFPTAGKPGDPEFDRMPVTDQKAVNATYANIGKAIAAYESKLVCKNSAFDKFIDGDESAMSPAAVRGMRLFIGRAGCLECHGGGTFSDYEFHNIGVPQVGEHVLDTDAGRVDGVPQVKGDIFNRAGEFSDRPSADHLQTLAEGMERDVGAFKTPSLRCVSQTAPYMHNGVYPDLWSVLEHYRFGGNTGNFSGVKDVVIQPLDLEDEDLDDLVEFLKSLDGEPLPEPLVNVPQLP